MTICRRTSTNRMALANGIRDATVTYMLSTNAIPFVKEFVWLLRSFTPTHTFYIRFTYSRYNLRSPILISPKISCQKAPCLWQPTVATAKSHLAGRLERKHTRHECRQSLLNAPAASLCLPLFIDGEPFPCSITSSLPCGTAPTAQFHTHPFLVVTLYGIIYSRDISIHRLCRFGYFPQRYQLRGK